MLVAVGMLLAAPMDGAPVKSFAFFPAGGGTHLSDHILIRQIMIATDNLFKPVPAAHDLHHQSAGMRMTFVLVKDIPFFHRHLETSLLRGSHPAPFIHAKKAIEVAREQVAAAFGTAPAEVVFTAGGTGAGKTTGMEIVKKVDPTASKAELVYDTNMNTFDSADKKIRQALDHKRDVDIIYTYRDPVEALSNGALKRAQRMEEKMGTGRTVPLSEHMKTHMGARQVIEQLAAKYRNNPNVRIRVIDNSLGAGKARLSALDKLPKLNENEVRKGLRDALERAKKSGSISERIYRGTADYLTR